MSSAAILDVDGTLVDTNYHHAIAWFRAFRQHGHVVPIWRIHRHIGMGGDKLVSALLSDEVEELMAGARVTAFFSLSGGAPHGRFAGPRSAPGLFAASRGELDFPWSTASTHRGSPMADHPRGTGRGLQGRSRTGSAARAWISTLCRYATSARATAGSRSGYRSIAAFNCSAVSGVSRWVSDRVVLARPAPD